jgi:putative oxidoreductase
VVQRNPPQETIMTATESYAAAAGRVLLSAIFLMSGFGKLTDRTGTIQYIEAAGLPLPSIAYIIALVCEIGGGLAILVGFRARIAAAVLCIFTLAAAIGFHSNFADPDMVIHFMKNVAMAGGFLMIVAFGPGPLSVDERMRSRTTLIAR